MVSINTSWLQQNNVLNYTSIDPKQQQTMISPRRSCAIKNPLVAPFLIIKRNERKEAPEPEPGTRRNQKIMMEHNPFPEKGKKRKVKSRETSPGTPAKIRRNQEIMMKQNPFPDKRKKRKVRRQAPEPYPEPESEGTKKWWWNRMPEE